MKPRQKGMRRSHLKHYSSSNVHGEKKVDREYFAQANQRANTKPFNESFDSLFPIPFSAPRLDASGNPMFGDDPRHEIIKKIKEILEKESTCVLDNSAQRISLVYFKDEDKDIKRTYHTRAFLVRHLKNTNVIHQSVMYASKEQALDKYRREQVRWLSPIIE